MRSSCEHLLNLRKRSLVEHELLRIEDVVHIDEVGKGGLDAGQVAGGADDVRDGLRGHDQGLAVGVDCAQETGELLGLDLVHLDLVDDDDVSGLNFDDNTLQDTFRVLYFKEPDRTVTEKEICEKVQDSSSDEEDYFPVRGCYGLAFSAGVDTISSGDYRFENCIKKLVRQDYPEKAESLLENIDDFMDENGKDWGGGHKIGGYPGFTQWDPRGEGDSHDMLLFQLDSDCHNSEDRVLWGDCGIGNFFINREKLKSCDFSDVIYNWDCC